MNYVAHICRNKKCDAIWIDKDLTRCTSIPPSWKYCRECAEKLGIDYDAQTPESNLSEEELKIKKEKRLRFELNKKNKSEQIKQG